MVDDLTENRMYFPSAVLTGDLQAPTTVSSVCRCQGSGKIHRGFIAARLHVVGLPFASPSGTVSA
jgi:hypothetical protein